MVGCGGGIKLEGFFFFRFNAGLSRQLNTPGIPVMTPFGAEFMLVIMGNFLSPAGFESRPLNALLV